MGPRKAAGLTELPGQLTQSGARGKTKGVLSGAAEAISDASSGHVTRPGNVRATMPRAGGGNELVRGTGGRSRFQGRGV